MQGSPGPDPDERQPAAPSLPAESRRHHKGLPGISPTPSDLHVCIWFCLFDQDRQPFLTVTTRESPCGATLFAMRIMLVRKGFPPGGVSSARLALDAARVMPGNRRGRAVAAMQGRTPKALDKYTGSAN